MFPLFLPGCFLLTEAQLADRLAHGAVAADSGPDSGGADDSGGHGDSGEPEDTGAERTFYRDADADGSGDPGASLLATVAPEGYVENAWDCLDTDASEPVWVATDGLPSGPGSFDMPYAAMSDAVLDAFLCVRIRPGVYTGAVDLGGHNLDIEGIEGSAVTTLDALSGGPVVSVNGGENATLAGLTLTGGSGSQGGDYAYGGGVLVINPAKLSMHDVVITGNVAINGGGIYTTSPDLQLEQVVIAGNDAYAGGGFLQEGGAVRGSQVRLLDNTGGYGVAGYSAGGTLELTNVIAGANRGTEGIDGFYLVSSSTQFVNVTIVDHDYALAVESSAEAPGSLTLVNSILGGGEFGLVLYGEPLAEVRYSWFFGHSGRDWYPDESNIIGTAGNVSQDPVFAAFTANGAAGDDDLHLAVGSPALDAGDPAVLDADGSRSDVGAYGGPAGSWP
ncbi:hypothetical protein LBMAG42_09320 [Deltaproteobacteria bacterium]|nr:hypothetical protein LBMAG42_09320 [Deltaproteobacteria bacterium]